MTKAAELREMSDEQLGLVLKETTENLFRLRLQAQSERLDAPSELQRHRRTIARVKTIQSERATSAVRDSANADKDSAITDKASANADRAAAITDKASANADKESE